MNRDADRRYIRAYDEVTVRLDAGAHLKVVCAPEYYQGNNTQSQLR